MERRQFIATGAAAIGSMPLTARAQDAWPVKPIKVIVGYPVGGAADAISREILPFLQEKLGQPLVLDYRPGAGGAIAAEAVAHADPDGYTLGMLDNGPMSVVPHLRKVTYDPIKSFTSIASATSGGLLIIATSTLPINSLEELIAYAKKNPGRLSYASAGQGSLHQLAGELLKSQTNSFMVHVPYRGSAQALTDVARGQIDLAIASVAPSLGLIKEGRIKCLATTSARRLTALPNIPTVHEKAIPGYDVMGWFGFIGPVHLPRSISLKFELSMRTLSKDSLAIKRLQMLGADMADGTSEQLKAWIQKDLNRWGRLIKYAGIKAE